MTNIIEYKEYRNISLKELASISTNQILNVVENGKTLIMIECLGTLENNPKYKERYETKKYFGKHHVIQNKNNFKTGIYFCMVNSNYGRELKDKDILVFSISGSGFSNMTF